MSCTISAFAHLPRFLREIIRRCEDEVREEAAQAHLGTIEAQQRLPFMRVPETCTPTKAPVRCAGTGERAEETVVWLDEMMVAKRGGSSAAPGTPMKMHDTPTCRRAAARPGGGDQ